MIFKWIHSKRFFWIICLDYLQIYTCYISSDFTDIQQISDLAIRSSQHSHQTPNSIETVNDKHHDSLYVFAFAFHRNATFSWIFHHFWLNIWIVPEWKFQQIFNWTEIMCEGDVELYSETNSLLAQCWWNTFRTIVVITFRLYACVCVRAFVMANIDFGVQRKSKQFV